jgi:hypothetical protein
MRQVGGLGVKVGNLSGGQPILKRTRRIAVSSPAAGMAASICFNPAGAIAPPPASRTLKPQSSGGLWLAVILSAAMPLLAGTL